MINVPTRLLLIGLVLGLWGTALLAQVKYEKEERIPEEEVPSPALDFVDEIEPTRKVDWYREENLEGEAFEVKLKRKGDRFSIKFDLEGKLIDVEKQIQWREIPEDVREEIREELEEDFDRYRIEKIQAHYKSKAKYLITFIQTGQQRKVEKSLQYEIVLKGKRKGKYHLYEAVFDREGEDERIERILTRRTDNMEF